jgi:hypothetical protein
MALPAHLQHLDRLLDLLVESLLEDVRGDQDTAPPPPEPLLAREGFVESSGSIFTKRNGAPPTKACAPFRGITNAHHISKAAGEN